MLQIKTVIVPAEDYQAFDKRVNELLSQGWELTARKIIGIKGEPNEVGSAAVVHSLCAELVKYRGVDYGKERGKTEAGGT